MVKITDALISWSPDFRPCTALTVLTKARFNLNKLHTRWNSAKWQNYLIFYCKMYNMYQLMELMSKILRQSSRNYLVTAPRTWLSVAVLKVVNDSIESHTTKNQRVSVSLRNFIKFRYNSAFQLVNSSSSYVLCITESEHT